MHPVLFRIGTLPINSYGLMLAASFLLGVRLAASRAYRLGIPKDDTINLSVWIMVAAIVGSRFFYVITHLDQYEGDPIAMIAFWRGLYGLSMLGGVVLAMITGFTWIILKKWPVWAFADAVIPSFALGIFVTRIGCFFNGCCFGYETLCPLGVSFPQGSLPYEVFGAHPVHPSQLYSSAGGLIIFIVLLAAGARRHFPGFIFSLFTGLYGATRFGMEEFRYFDHDPIAILGYSSLAERPGITDNQLISLFMVAVSLVLGAWLFFRSRRDSS